MSELFRVQVEMGQMKVKSNLIRKDGLSYLWVMKIPKPNPPQPDSSQPDSSQPDPSQPGLPQRTVFIGVLPGSWTLFNPSHQGTSMFSTHSAGPFPGIRAIGDIRGNRRWVVGVLQNVSSSPTRTDFDNAQYFQCQGERREINIRQLEAWQPVGITELTDEAISSYERKLWEEWNPADYDWRLWNSQNFSLFLAFLIILDISRGVNLPALTSLRRDLRWKQANRLGEVTMRRHFTVMVVMGPLAIATGGIGAVGSCGFGAYNMFDFISVGESHASKVQRLITEFPELQPLLQ